MLDLNVKPLGNERDARNESLDADLDRRSRELQLLANFYHQHDFQDRAQELYRVVLRIREDREQGMRIAR